MDKVHLGTVLEQQEDMLSGRQNHVQKRLRFAGKLPAAISCGHSRSGEWTRISLFSIDAGVDQALCGIPPHILVLQNASGDDMPWPILWE